MKRMRKENISRLWVGFVLTFLVFVWAPSEFYLTNLNDVWFDISDILKCSIPLTLIILVCLSIVILFGNELIKNIIDSVAFSLLFGFYIQGNWINPNYGVMNGEEIKWSNYTVYGIIDTLFWIVVFLLPLILLYFYKTKKWLKFLNTISTVIFLILAITMITLVFTQNLNNNTKKTDNIVVTNKNIFNLGDQKNVVVFILDSLDSELYDKVCAEDSSFYKDFENFTYYNNMTGMYPTTQASIPYIITGEEYSNQLPYYTWLEDAYKKSEIFNVIKENNYKAGFYAPNYIAKDSSIGTIENIENVHDNKPNDIGGLYQKWMELVLFRYMPHYLKNNFVVYTGELDQYKSAIEFGEDDITFYNKLSKDGMVIDKGESALRIYHLQGAHPPFVYDENVLMDEKSDQIKQAKGALHIVKLYIDMLKKNNIYEQTAIVICADHGSAAWSGLSQTPLTMVKGFGESHAFVANDFPVSYSELNNTILSLLDGNLDRNTIWNNGDKPLLQRRFLYYALEEKNRNMDYMPVMYEYWIGKNKNDVEKGNYYYDDLGIHEIMYYSVNNELEIDITDDKNYLKVCDYGLQYFSNGSGSDKYRWTSGKETALTVCFEDKSKNYRMRLNILGTLGEQLVRCLIKDQVISEVVANTSEIDIIIPKEFIKDKKTQIILQWPNAVRASEFIDGSTDNSMYAAQIKNIKFSKLD